MHKRLLVVIMAQSLIALLYLLVVCLVLKASGDNFVNETLRSSPRDHRGGSGMITNGTLRDHLQQYIEYLKQGAKGGKHLGYYARKLVTKPGVNSSSKSCFEVPDLRWIFLWEGRFQRQQPTQVQIYTPNKRGEPKNPQTFSNRASDCFPSNFKKPHWLCLRNKLSFMEIPTIEISKVI